MKRIISCAPKSMRIETNLTAYRRVLKTLTFFVALFAVIAAITLLTAPALRSEAASPITSTIVPDGIYMLKNVASGYYMDVQSNQTTAGGAIGQYNYGSDSSASADRSSLYKIERIGTSGRYIIRTMRNNLNIVVKYGSEVKTKAYYGLNSAADTSDTWTITYDSNGYVLKPADSSSYAASVQNTTGSGAGSPGSTLALQTPSSAGNRAKWGLIPYTDGIYGIEYEAHKTVFEVGETYQYKVASAWSNTYGVGGNIVWSLYNGGSDKAEISGDGVFTAKKAGTVQIFARFQNAGWGWMYVVDIRLNDGIYRIDSIASNAPNSQPRTIDLSNGIWYSGNGVIQYQRNSDPMCRAQLWAVTHVGDGYYTVASTVKPDMLLSNDGGAMKIYKSGDITASRQKWKLVSSASGGYTLENSYSGTYLAVTASNANGNALLLAASASADTSRWNFVRFDEPFGEWTMMQDCERDTFNYSNAVGSNVYTNSYDYDGTFVWDIVFRYSGNGYDYFSITNKKTNLSLRAPSNNTNQAYVKEEYYDPSYASYFVWRKISRSDGTFLLQSANQADRNAPNPLYFAMLDNGLLYILGQLQVSSGSTNYHAVWRMYRCGSDIVLLGTDSNWINPTFAFGQISKNTYSWNNSGYQTYNFRYPTDTGQSDVISLMQNAKIFVSNTHGGHADYPNTGDSNSFIFPNEATEKVVSGIDLYDFDINYPKVDLSNLDLILFIGCNTAYMKALSNPHNIANAAYLAGATVSIGFSDTLYAPLEMGMTKWERIFFECLSEGKSVDAAKSTATNSLIGLYGSSSCKVYGDGSKKFN